MKFLIDECLTTSLIFLAQRAGHEAYHVAHVGRAGWKDWNIFRHAIDNDLIVVTNNAADFRKLYARQPLHAGLLVILPNVGRNEQGRLFDHALRELASFGEPVNHVMEVDYDGDEVVVSIYEMPASE